MERLEKIFGFPLSILFFVPYDDRQDHGTLPANHDDKGKNNNGRHKKGVHREIDNVTGSARERGRRVTGGRARRA